jgi:predicted O-linked N-acetylglucosamine transferase (SPINDLY family)
VSSCGAPLLCVVRSAGGAPPPSGLKALTPYDSTLLPHVSSGVHKALTAAYLGNLHHSARCSLGNATAAPLRVAYMSFDFRDHAMGHLTQGLVSSHDRRAFHTIAASYGPDDDSPYRARVRSGVDTFLDLETTPDVQAACGLLAGEAPHIVVDLMGLTRGTRAGLAALRPAPIVVNYLG